MREFLLTSGLILVMVLLSISLASLAMAWKSIKDHDRILAEMREFFSTSCRHDVGRKS